MKAKITKVWYIDKFGQEKTLSQVRTNPNQWSESNGKNLCEITITPDENITGNIHVHGTVPENNTIRYITFELTNEDNITRTVTVAQYPLEYITNIQGGIVIVWILEEQIMKKVKIYIIHVLHLIQRALINGVFQLMIIIAFLV